MKMKHQAKRIIENSVTYYVSGYNPNTEDRVYLCRYYGGKRWFGRLNYENEEFETYEEALKVYKHLVKNRPLYSAYLDDLQLIEKNWNLIAVLEEGETNG